MEKLFTMRSIASPVASVKANPTPKSALSFLSYRSETFQELQKALDLATFRINLVNENIVNVQTPGYKAKRLAFGDMLAETSRSFRSDALREKYNKTPLYNGLRTRISDEQPYVYSDPSSAKLIDGNNVDINHENLELARTKLEYDYLVRKISDEYALLKHAVSEGKG